MVAGSPSLCFGQFVGLEVSWLSSAFVSECISMA